ncbi:hypothetical protein AZE42_09657 [Rhizopogon vesiculosus]|uniref:CxC1-like cysteine cluster associated with KDZ transposases domain-containing protein n=1 Tax=Rhizopogon vesiculosus TaxID=180088 RepID=A0A1J8QCH1_9AGAM|nr:hypothetical protein AZE42_09657 [Rhizopogon vesiculosus]
MAVRRPKRPRDAGSSIPSKWFHPLPDHPPPVTPTNSQPTTIICEPWMVRTHRAPQAAHKPAPPVLVLPGQQRFTQNVVSSSRHSIVQDENNPHPPIGADLLDIDPFIGDEPLFSDSLYMPDGPIDLPRQRLSSLQKKQNQWQRWSEEVIPSLISPYLSYIRQSASLQSIPDLGCSTGGDSHCSGFCRPQSLAVTCVLFDRLQVVNISCCECSPALLQLMTRGLIACAPIAPSLAVDIRVLELVKHLFVWMTPNSTAWVDCIVCIDACFTQKHSNNPRNGCMQDPPNPMPTVFIPEGDVKVMEDHVSSCRGRVRMPTRPRQLAEEVHDGYENGMRLPASVLDGCSESFVAADEKREKASTRFFADTGLMALLCQHDRVLWLVNMTSAGEKQHYSLALVKQLFNHLPPDMMVGLLYDIGCQLE